MRTVLLQKAFDRTLQHLSRLPRVISREGRAEPGLTGSLRSVNKPQVTSHKIALAKLLVHVASEDDGQGKSLQTDESYMLSVTVINSTAAVAKLEARNVYGALYGLTTFTQLFRLFDSHSRAAILGLPIAIDDAPRFTWRGILIDTANHFFPISDLQRLIDGMLYNKYNVLHMHIVDSYSFPFQSSSFPALSARGAWDAEAVYSPQDLSHLRRYADERGVRLVMEVDMPGHAYSWGLGHPNITAKCPGYGTDMDIGHVNTVPLDPSNPFTYTVVDGVLREMLSAVQPAEFVHLGGDEINVGCWNASTNGPLLRWKQDLNLTWRGVVNHFYRRVMNQTLRHRPGGVSKVVTWEDLFLDEEGQLDFTDVPFSQAEAVVEVWTDTKYLSQVVSQGYDGLFAAAWYLDRQQPVDGEVNWEWLDTMWQMYGVDPEEHVHPGSPGRVLGGEASMWSEQVSPLTLDARMWPRASPVAERLWSPRTVTDEEFAATRLREHRCRMVFLLDIRAGPFWSERCVPS